jgi:hypothetical protein
LAQTTVTDGAFEVLENWKGDLHAGHRVLIPELRPRPEAIPIALYPKSLIGALRSDITKLVPRQPIGSRVILFLKCPPSAECRTDKFDSPIDCQWEPLDPLLTVKNSAVWVDEGRLFRFIEFAVPGPEFIFEVPGSELKLKQRVAQVKAIQDRIGTILRLSGSERAEMLKSYVHSSIRSARQVALEELGKCGPDAVRSIRRMLDDPAYEHEEPELVNALLKSGGKGVGNDLNIRLQKEIAFWQAVGPTLPKGWWSTSNGPNSKLQEQYRLTVQLLLGLQCLHYQPALDSATTLRDLWRSIPSLNDQAGLDQMMDQCDRLIHDLANN